MSNQDQKSQVYEKMPYFTQYHIDWCVKALAIYPLSTAVEVFLTIFREFDHPSYGDEERIRKLIYDRLKDAKYRKTRPTRARIIKAKQALWDEAKQALSDELKQALGDDGVDAIIPFVHPRLLLGELYTLLYQEEKNSKKLLILDKIDKIIQKIRDHDGIPPSYHKSSHWAGAVEFVNKFRRSKTPRIAKKGEDT